MNKEFIEKQIEEVKYDLNFHETTLATSQATLDGVQFLPDGDLKTKLVKESTDEVKWYTKRIIHDHNMLDVLYTARDLTS